MRENHGQKVQERTEGESSACPWLERRQPGKKMKAASRSVCGSAERVNGIDPADVDADEAGSLSHLRSEVRGKYAGRKEGPLRNDRPVGAKDFSHRF